MVGYSYKPTKEKHAKALGKMTRASPKFSSEICREIKGKNVMNAKVYLEQVMAMDRAVPLRRFNKGVAHRRGPMGPGRYPIKSASLILKVLESAEANAEYKGLDVDRLQIIHAAAQAGRVIKGWRPRAYGRASPNNTSTTHIEIVLEER